MPNEKVKALYEKLKTGATALASSEAWAEYLRFQARFHEYSFANVLLISLQKPNATNVAGYKTWGKMGRHVKKGERGIAIFAPLIVKEKDEETEKEMAHLRGFKVVYVFDVSQTEGKPLPEHPARRLETASEAGEWLYRRLLEASPFPVLERELPGETNGYWEPENRRIVLRAGIAVDQKAKTLAHELAHAFTDDRENLNSDEAEVLAEGAAFVTASYFGLDTSGYSLGYIVNYSQENPEAVIRLGEQIQKVASKIIALVEGGRKNAKGDEAA